MNFIEHESPQKLRGGFYTDPDIADFLSRWVHAIQPRRILEPSCGDGAFIGAMQRAAPDWAGEFFACEINAEEATKARARAGDARITVHEGDFLRWYLFYGE